MRDRRGKEHLPLLDGGEVMLKHEGRARLEITKMTVSARAGEAVWQRGANADPGLSTLGHDELGDFTEQHLAAKSEWCAAALTTRAYAEPNSAAALVSARSWDSERWWLGDVFGLRGQSTVELELALPEFDVGLACALVEEWWTQPFFIASPADVPELSQFLLWRDKDGLYGALVPLVGGVVSSRLAGDGTRLRLLVSCGDEGRLEARGPAFVAGLGADPYELVQRLYAQGMQLSGHPGKLRLEKAYPPCFDYLGWCTWDAFYREVTAEKVQAQLAHFNDLKLPVGFLLIDDGWYPIAEQMLLSTSTDRTKFPADLGPLFAVARQQHGVRYVGVWHALTGYWSGIHPQHQLTGRQRENLQASKGGRLTPAQDAGGSFAFLSSWHESLAAQKTDFVKVDGQAAIHRYSRDRVATAEAAADVMRALQGSVGVHFQGQILNCMSMSQELAWFWSMSNVTRSSPDYMINGAEPNTAGHARANAYNSLWMGQLTWCDWDMFRTDQASATFHAALRAVSGGPIYLSDGLRTTLPKEVWPLISSDGRILRCDDVGVPTEDWLLSDPLVTPRAFKIKNRARHCFVVGLFNLCHDGTLVPGSITAPDVGLPPAAEVVVWSHRRRAGKRLRAGESYDFELPALGSDVVTIAQPESGFAPIGLAGKLVAAKTIATVRRTAGRATLELTDAGELVVYSEEAPTRVTVDGEPVPFSSSERWLIINVPAKSSLIVDIEWL